MYLAMARGGVYPQTFSENNLIPYDFSELHLRTVLSYIGINDVSVIKIEGTALPQMKEKALAKALSNFIL